MYQLWPQKYYDLKNTRWSPLNGHMTQIITFNQHSSDKYRTDRLITLTVHKQRKQTIIGSWYTIRVYTGFIVNFVISYYTQKDFTAVKADCLHCYANFHFNLAKNHKGSIVNWPNKSNLKEIKICKNCVKLCKYED
jgi:hypothetical protein